MRPDLRAIEAAAAAQAEATSPLPPALAKPVEPTVPDKVDATDALDLAPRLPEPPALTATFAARVDPELAQRVTYTCTVLGITKQAAAAAMMRLWLDAVAREYGIETTPPVLRPPSHTPGG